MKLNVNIENMDKFKNLLSIMSDILVDERINKTIREEYFHEITNVLSLKEVEDEN